MDDKFLDFIWDKESSKGTHPNKMKTGGDYQIREILYDDVNRISKEAKGKGWTFEEVINDSVKGRYYTSQAFDVLFPHYIKHYKLPDTPQIKISMWNWGVGKLQKAKGDLKQAPPITQKYLKDYNKLFKEKK